MLLLIARILQQQRCQAKTSATVLPCQHWGRNMLLRNSVTKWQVAVSKSSKGIGIIQKIRQPYPFCQTLGAPPLARKAAYLLFNSLWQLDGFQNTLQSSQMNSFFQYHPKGETDCFIGNSSNLDRCHSQQAAGLANLKLFRPGSDKFVQGDLSIPVVLRPVKPGTAAGCLWEVITPQVPITAERTHPVSKLSF